GARARLEEDLDDAHAGQRPGLHMVDAGAEREEPLEPPRDVVLDLLGRHAVVEGCHHDLRDVDRRKEIDRHARAARHAHDGDDRTDNEDEMRIADGESSHQRSPLSAVALWTLGVTIAPGLSCDRLPTTTSSPSPRPADTSMRSLVS